MMGLFRPAETTGKVDGTKAKYVGTVIYNDDPKKIGRVKVTIPNLFVGAQEELPWCYPHNPSQGGGKVGSGSVHVPEVGAELVIIFENGDYLNPKYIGSNQNTETIDPVFAEDYPNTYGHIDSTGFYWKMNKSTQLLTVHHPGGVDITIDADGKMTIKSTTDSILIQAASKIQVEAPEIDLTASTKVVVEAPEIDLDASTKVVVSAPRVNVDSNSINFN